MFVMQHSLMKLHDEDVTMALINVHCLNVTFHSLENLLVGVNVLMLILTHHTGGNGGSLPLKYSWPV